ncbi:uncharacterized protein LOC114317826 isoform X1 [Camellia sinensis]|uniref:uncharacterized protein LOC114317826 isoform X1 n=1 Tax=Camellia sinensis TaxID=4442 RepID=UPI0010358C9C|nr:uncharacterized protein LOC114317826 isoform X1 [Camellia sinensis]
MPLFLCAALFCCICASVSMCMVKIVKRNHYLELFLRDGCLIDPCITMQYKNITYLYMLYIHIYICFFFPSFFMSSPGMNLITTIIGFGMIATFIVFVCSRLIFGRIRGVGSRQMSEIESRIDLEQAANIEAEGSGIPDCEYQLTKHEVSCLGHGKYSECSTTESSDDIEKQELEDVSDEDDTSYFDTIENFSETTLSCGSVAGVTDNISKCMGPEKQFDDRKNLNAQKEAISSTYPQIERRKKLPDPVEKEKGVSLWSMIKDNVGKDLTRVCLPVYFNEPISSLQKCFEDLEYSYLLDRAYEHGKAV